MRRLEGQEVAKVRGRTPGVNSISQEEPCLLYAKFVLALSALRCHRPASPVACGVHVEGTTGVSV